MESRLLIFAPYGRDAQVIRDVLATRQVVSHICVDQETLIEELSKASAATIVTEETLGDGLNEAIRAYLGKQPPWSDYPFVVLATRDTVRRSEQARSVLRELGNMVLLERPVNPDTLASAAQSAIRARRRQYGTREHLEQLQQSKLAVDRSNAELETRIANRTNDLASANDRLMHEIAERERVQHSVVQNQKMEAIGRLTGGIAHDFNNLLHVVNLNLQLIDRLAARDERLLNYARRAKEAVGRGSRLTGQLLSFARTQSLVPKLHDVNELVRNMAELISVSVGTHVRVSLQLHPGPAHAVVDSAQLEMAILNLAVNSRDAMPNGGTLEIMSRVRTEPASADAAADGHDKVRPDSDVKSARPVIELVVTDSGEGIPPSLLEKVFEPFFTTKQHGHGTGLGLSQVYGFARQSGGGAEVNSTVGEGTTVMLRFPLAEPPVDEVEATPSGRLEDSSQSRAEVLVVEDDPSVRRSIVECLQVLGFRVREAADGAAGLKELEKSRPDLLLVDYLMPRMNGAELIVHARKRWGDIPVLLATGYADMNAVEQLIGPQSVLAKPFDLDTLGKAVSSELRRSHAAVHAGK